MTLYIPGHATQVSLQISQLPLLVTQPGKPFFAIPRSRASSTNCSLTHLLPVRSTPPPPPPPPSLLPEPAPSIPSHTRTATSFDAGGCGPQASKASDSEGSRPFSKSARSGNPISKTRNVEADSKTLYEQKRHAWHQAGIVNKLAVNHQGSFKDSAACMLSLSGGPSPSYIYFV